MKSWEEQQLECLCSRIKPLDETAMEACRNHWDRIAKPLNGLGRMEDILTRIGGIQQREAIRISKKAVVVFCSDNGVVKEGVTQTDSSVTAAVVNHIAAGTASVNRMAQTAGADVIPVDVGVAGKLTEPGIFNRKISSGTGNLYREPAMTREQAVQAIHVGISLAGELVDAGYELLAAGEMGIGNTTTSSAVASVLLGLPAEQVTGRGAGLSDHGYRRKIQVIREALERHQVTGQDPLGLLAAVGGYDIAAMTGLYIGGAVYRVPVVLDGMIAATAGVLAKRLCPLVPDYLLPSHLGREPACRLLMQDLGMEPVIDAWMALGEGTGAVMLFPLLDMAAAVYHQGYTFAAGNIDNYQHLH
ncbi:MAG: nicotinate-nucleotide--dimethylbenzimidazole phosphoribosyltransferase [Lachnospiraceae bacterium]